MPAILKATRPTLPLPPGARQLGRARQHQRRAPSFGRDMPLSFPHAAFTTTTGMIAGAESGQSSEAGKVLAGLRVLLAEDSWHIGQALKMVLESEGAAVHGPAVTVSEAQRLAASATSDVAVIDLNLDGVIAFDLI